jgi:hypothetical protein
VRYIDRWNFNNGPIVYYLTNEIPAEYKEPIRKALLEWNAAFAKSRHPQCDRGARSAGRSELGSRRRTLLDRPLDHERPPRSSVAYGPQHRRSATRDEIIRVEIVIDGEERCAT